MYLAGDRSPVNVSRKGGRSPDGELALYLRARIFFRRFAVHGSRGDERREWEDGTSPRLIKSLMRQHAFRPFPLSQDTGGRVMVPGKGTLDGTMHQRSVGSDWVHEVLRVHVDPSKRSPEYERGLSGSVAG